MFVLTASPAKQQATLLQPDVKSDAHGHSALTSTSILLLLFRTACKLPMLQRQTSAADVFELQLPCSMVSRPRKVALCAAGSLSSTGAGTEGGTYPSCCLSLQYRRARACSPSESNCGPKNRCPVRLLWLPCTGSRLQLQVHWDRTLRMLELGTEHTFRQHVFACSHGNRLTQGLGKRA